MNTFKSFLWITAAGALLASCSGKGKADMAAEMKEELPLVKVENVYEEEVPQESEYTATVEAFKTNNISSATGNRIKRILVDVGSNVRAGQQVVILDDVSITQQRAALDQQRIALANQKLSLDRAKELVNIGGGTQQTVDQLQAQYDAQARAIDASARALRNMQENTVLTSPISGVVTARNYDNGDLYNGQQPVLVVQKVNPVKLVLNVSETYFRNMKVGMPISDISLDAYPGETFTGKVSIIYPTVDSNTRTFPVEVTISNPNQRVRPGMFARVTLNFGSSNSVMVPDQAICKQTGSGERFVYVVNPDSTVTHKTIDLGRREGAEYVVNSGVESGATVVVFGQTLLTDGRKIHVLN